MNDHYYAVIMAGGGGTRLWPLSRTKRPKQMLKLFGDQSLFQTAVNRLEGLFSKDHILVVTIKGQVEALKDQCPGIPDENFLIEPVPRGTASVVCYAAMALEKRDPEAVMAVLTADHYIGDEAAFRMVLASARDAAGAGYLVTLGIQPDYPSTGFGYIQIGKSIGDYGGIGVFLVERFIEKPDEDLARELVANGQHYWNSGMFIWRVDVIMRAFKKQMPGLWQSIQEISQSWGKTDQNEVLENVWENLVPETIDYGIMENAKNVAVVPAINLNWNDVGSWDALFDVMEADEHGNILMGGTHLLNDTSGSLVFSDQSERLLVTIGVKDLILVDMGDVLMVCHKDYAQQVRQVVEQLKKAGNRQRL
jgi:mannose-1-phosphate guanylyltransferase